MLMLLSMTALSLPPCYPAAIRDVPHPSDTKSRLQVLLLLLLLLLPLPVLLQTSQPPDGTWLNAGPVMLCLTRPLIAHQPLLSTLMLMLMLRAWTTARDAQRSPMVAR